MNFGFKVRKKDGGYLVSLPHQCDRWEIVATFTGLPVSQEQAVAKLEQFLVEAEIALDAVRAGKEMGV